MKKFTFYLLIWNKYVTFALSNESSLLYCLIKFFKHEIFRIVSLTGRKWMAKEAREISSRANEALLPKELTRILNMIANTASYGLRELSPYPTPSYIAHLLGNELRKLGYEVHYSNQCLNISW